MLQILMANVWKRSVSLRIFSIETVLQAWPVAVRGEIAMPDKVGSLRLQSSGRWACAARVFRVEVDGELRV
jgi:hypothetical protein